MTHRRRVAALLRRLHADDVGASPITSVFGLAVFLGFLLFSVQVILYLFTASVAQAAALDGANLGSGASAGGSVAVATDHARNVLGGFGDTALVTGRLIADAAGEQLVVTVTVDTPSAVAAGFGLRTITREAAVRVER